MYNADSPNGHTRDVSRAWCKNKNYSLSQARKLLQTCGELEIVSQPAGNTAFYLGFSTAKTRPNHFVSYGACGGCAD